MLKHEIERMTAPVPRRWFRGCYLCPMPRREHDDACPFSRAIRHEPQVPGVVTLGDLRNRLRLTGRA